jgi:hypothetical protein
MAKETTADSPLGLALENLYDAFAHLGPTDYIYFCDHCVGENFAEELNISNTKAISHQALSELVGNTFLLGEDYECRRVFPRIMQLAVEPQERTAESDGLHYREGDVGMAEDFLQRIRLYENYDGWPEEEKEAVETFFSSIWELMLAEQSSILHKTQFLCPVHTLPCIAYMTKDLEPYFRRWQASGPLGAAILVHYLLESRPLRDLSDVFRRFFYWGESINQERYNTEKLQAELLTKKSQFLNWLVQPELRSWLWSYAEEMPWDGEQSEWFEAIDVLEKLAAAESKATNPE